jgi:ligand-binding sensor domain-containing protein
MDRAGRLARVRCLALVVLLAGLTAVASPAAGESADGNAPRIRAQRVLDVPLAVAHMAMVGDQLWIGSRGGGVMAFSAGRIGKRFDLGRGLPSAFVHDLGGLGDGRVVVGTDRGAVVIDPRTNVVRPIQCRASAVRRPSISW